MNLETLNKQRRFILIAATVGIISVFLPWMDVTVSVFGTSISKSFNGFRDWGVVAFFGYVAAVAMSFVGSPEQPLERKMWLGTMLAAALAFLLTFVSMFNKPEGLDAGVGSAEVKTGYGVWLSLVASAGMLGAAWAFKHPEDTLQGSIAGLRKEAGFIRTTVPSASRPSATGTGNKMDELDRLHRMKMEGKISEDEWMQMKADVLA